MSTACSYRVCMFARPPVSLCYSPYHAKCNGCMGWLLFGTWLCRIPLPRPPPALSPRCIHAAPTKPMLQASAGRHDTPAHQPQAARSTGAGMASGVPCGARQLMSCMLPCGPHCLGRPTSCCCHALTSARTRHAPAPYFTRPKQTPPPPPHPPTHPDPHPRCSAGERTASPAAAGAIAAADSGPAAAARAAAGAGPAATGLQGTQTQRRQQRLQQRARGEGEKAPLAASLSH